MNGEILFLAHRIPFPPDRGDKIRSHHILKELADLAPVHVAISRRVIPLRRMAIASELICSSATTPRV